MFIALTVLRSSVGTVEITNTDKTFSVSLSETDWGRDDFLQDLVFTVYSLTVKDQSL